MSRLEIAWIANCGIFLRSENRSLMVDGLFGKSEFFSPMPKEMKKAAFGMNSAYRDIDYVLFTHRHDDHFNAGMADEYAHNNAVKKLIVPVKGNDPKSFMEDRGSMKKAAAKGILTEAEIEFGMHKTYAVENASDGGDTISAEYICCRHLDWKTYPAVVHCAVLLVINGIRLLFLADADSSAENATLFEGVEKPDAVFVTPLFYLNPDGRAILQKMSPVRTIIYHLPFAEDDVTELRSLAEKLMYEHIEDASLMQLCEPGQKLIIERN